MSELRLTYVEWSKLGFAKPKPIIMALDIQEALNEWRDINADPRKWATFEAIQFKHERVVCVTWGVIHSNDFKECALQTINYAIQKDGTVYEYKHTHF